MSIILVDENVARSTGELFKKKGLEVKLKAGN